MENNLFYDDGLEWVMIYDYVHLREIVEGKMIVKINLDNLIVKFGLEN